MKHVLILKWKASDYDSLSGLLDLAGKELKADGCMVTTIDAESEGWCERVFEVCTKNPIIFVLGMSGIGSDITVNDNKLLWEFLKVPFYTWYCDHPAYDIQRHLSKNPYIIQSYVFPDHARYAFQHLPTQSMLAATHLGMPTRPSVGCGSESPSERNGRFIFTKSGGDPAALEEKWKATLPPSTRTILMESCEELWGKSVADFPGVIQSRAEEYGFFLDPSSKTMLGLISMADNYIRAKMSCLVVKSIINYPVDVYGKNWDHITFDKKAVYYGPLGFGETINRLPSYLGSISINPLVEESVHDRVFTALSARVVPLSTQNRFLTKEYKKLKNYTFSLSAHSIEAAISAVLDDPAQALAMTEESYHDTYDRFSLLTSVRLMQEFCQLHKFNMRS